MSKAAHTPTPWRLIIEGDGEDEMIIRTILSPVKNAPRNLNEICLFTTGSFPDEIEEANAEFMITAVNHHQELITRLYNLVNQAELVLSDIDSTSCIDGPEVRPHGLRLALVDANETLKKLIP